jgi:hypothetical protein
MCLQVSKDAKPKIASRPITVWKKLVKYGSDGLPHYRAEHHDYLYRPGYLNVEERGLQAELGEVDIAFHSMKYRETVRKWLWISAHGALCKFVIPKGALYYKGKYDDHVGYASDKIIFIEEVSAKQEWIYFVKDATWGLIKRFLGI